MDIIIEEIRYWKKNQLLPDMYCDYLLALYTKGANELEPDLNKLKKRKKATIITSIQLILLLFMIPFSFLVMYVLPYIFVLKILIMILLIGYVGWTLHFFKHRDMMFVHISMMILFLLILLCSVYMSHYFDFVQWITIGLILCNMAVWFFIGIILRIKYLVVASVFGIFMTIIYYFSTTYVISL